MHPYDADYLIRFTTRCIRALGVASIWALQRLLTADLSWASGCSGTECPAYVFAAIAAGMAEVDADLSGSFVHCFSAEMDEAKRNFITQVHGLDHVIFADLFDVSRPRAQDTVSGRWLTLPDFLGLGILIAGFSCKVASTLNTAMLARTDVHNIIDEMVSSTGLTFWATLLAVDRLRPKAFLLENVMGLLRNGAAESVAVALRAKGYVVALLQLQPKKFGFPNTRPRLFFLGLRRDLCGLHPEAEAEQKLVDLVWKQAEGQVVLTIDEVFLSEEEPIIADMRQQMVEKLHAPTKASKTLADSAQETGRDVFLAGLGFYGKAYDRVQERLDGLQKRVETRRKNADKAYKELVKRGKKVEKEAKVALDDLDIPKLDNLTDRKKLEQQLNKARARFGELKESVGLKSAA